MELSISPNSLVPARFPVCGLDPAVHPLGSSGPFLPVTSSEPPSPVPPVAPHPFFHPSSGLLPSPWALTRAPPGPPCLHSQPLPSWPQRGLSTPAHSPPWLPSAPRTEPQPLSLACEAMPLCSPHSPVSPTQPFCHPKLVAATEPRHQHQMLSGVPGTQDELRECLPTRRFSSCCLPLPLPAQLH